MLPSILQLESADPGGGILSDEKDKQPNLAAYGKRTALSDYLHSRFGRPTAVPEVRKLRQATDSNFDAAWISTLSLASGRMIRCATCKAHVLQLGREPINLPGLTTGAVSALLETDKFPQRD